MPGPMPLAPLALAGAVTIVAAVLASADARSRSRRPAQAVTPAGGASGTLSFTRAKASRA
jgi:hypothetical protein